MVPCLVVTHNHREEIKIKIKKNNSKEETENNTLSNTTVDSIRYKSSTFALTGTSDKSKNDLTNEIENCINHINEMNDSEINEQLNNSYNNHDEILFSQLIRGLFRGYQNYSHHYLSLQKNRNDNQEQVIDDDDDNDNDKQNIKTGEMLFMQKSITFFNEFC
eukprot:182550_1